MIEPFVPEGCSMTPDGGRALSYGLSAYGYDARMAAEILMPREPGDARERYTPLDPKRPSEAAYEAWRGALGESFAIPPHGFILTRTMEYFRIPRDITG
jgi:dCTP deaminase